jgi:hypothetical protein
VTLVLLLALALVFELVLALWQLESIEHKG